MIFLSKIEIEHCQIDVDRHIKWIRAPYTLEEIEGQEKLYIAKKGEGESVLKFAN